MSIAGLWGTAPVTELDARRMLEAFAHPSWAVRSQADSTARVAIAWAPAVLDATAHPSGVIVAGDLRLHNQPELAALLGVPSDVGPRWLVAEAYARFGAEFPRQMQGDFGLAIWDGSARRLLLARDSGGACPLFYSLRYGRVAFASHPRGLLTLPGFPRQLSARAVVDYLGELPQVEASTLFETVLRVPPGCTLAVDQANDRLVRYFDVESVPELCLNSDADYARALREALARAVDRRLPESRKLAVMLSGGLDSSSVALLASRTSHDLRPALSTVSGIFPQFPESDERKYQQEVVQAAGSQHYEVRPDPLGSAGDFARLCRIFSEPAFIGPHWLAWEAAEVASRIGATAMMTGIDGDRVISHGAGRIGELAAERDWLGFARELLAVSDYGWARRLRVGAVQAGLSLLTPRAADFLDSADPRRGRRFRQLAPLLRPEAVARYEIKERLNALPLRARSTRAEHARALLAPDRNWDVELLEQLGTAFNVRFEQPFFDRQVVELCFSFPGSQKRRRGLSRFVLRNAMASLLPESVATRRADAAFDRPYWAWARAWLVAQGAEKGEGKRLQSLDAYVNIEEVERQLRDLPLEPVDGPVDFLWRCVVLSRWLEETGVR